MTTSKATSKTEAQSSLPSSLPVEIYIHTWFVEPVPLCTIPPSKPAIWNGSVRIWGRLSDQRWWRTSIISKRVSSRTIFTDYGRLVHLVGPLYQRHARKFHLTEGTITAFNAGLPEDWQQRLTRELHPFFRLSRPYLESQRKEKKRKEANEEEQHTNDVEVKDCKKSTARQRGKRHYKRKLPPLPTISKKTKIVSRRRSKNNLTNIVSRTAATVVAATQEVGSQSEITISRRVPSTRQALQQLARQIGTKITASGSLRTLNTLTRNCVNIANTTASVQKEKARRKTIENLSGEKARISSKRRTSSTHSPTEKENSVPTSIAHTEIRPPASRRLPKTALSRRPYLPRAARSSNALPRSTRSSNALPSAARSSNALPSAASHPSSAPPIASSHPPSVPPSVACSPRNFASAPSCAPPCALSAPSSPVRKDVASRVCTRGAITRSRSLCKQVQIVIIPDSSSAIPSPSTSPSTTPSLSPSLPPFPPPSPPPIRRKRNVRVSATKQEEKKPQTSAGTNNVRVSLGSDGTSRANIERRSDRCVSFEPFLTKQDNEIRPVSKPKTSKTGRTTQPPTPKRPAVTVKGSGNWTEEQRQAFERQRNAVAANETNYWQKLARGVPEKSASECRALWEASLSLPHRAIHSKARIRVPTSKLNKTAPSGSPFASVHLRPAAQFNKSPIAKQKTAESEGRSTPEVVMHVRKASRSKKARGTAKYRSNVRRLAEIVARDTPDDLLEPKIVTPNALPGASLILAQMRKRGEKESTSTPNQWMIGGSSLLVEDGTPGTEVRMKRADLDRQGKLETPEILARGKAVGQKESDSYVAMFKKRLDNAAPCAPRINTKSPKASKVNLKPRRVSFFSDRDSEVDEDDNNGSEDDLYHWS